MLGICALFVCPPICGVLALVYGYKARAEIDASGGQLTGRGLAVAGIVMGWIGTVLITIGIMAAIALPSLLDQRGSGTESRGTGDDAVARTNARNRTSELEFCKASTGSYAACAERPSDLAPGTQVRSTPNGFVVTSTSKTGTVYEIDVDTGRRSCVGNSGCENGVW